MAARGLAFDFVWRLAFEEYFVTLDLAFEFFECLACDVRIIIQLYQNILFCVTYHV